MKLIDPSQRISVLWDNDDGTRYSEEMTIRRLLAVMSDDEVKTITITCCGECRYSSQHAFGYGCKFGYHLSTDGSWYCGDGERRKDDDSNV